MKKRINNIVELTMLWTNNFSSFRIFILLLVFIINSCTTKTRLFNQTIFSDFNQLKITQAIACEKKNNSKDVSRSYFVDIDEGIYPNRNQFKLEIAKTFKRKEKSGLELKVDYYYIKIDSSVKLILYEWNEVTNMKLIDYEDEKNKLSLFNTFQIKFNQLTDSMTKHLGEPFHKYIDQNNNSFETFRDDIKWKGNNGLNAYLFMFGNNNNGYRQIRLALYKD